MTHYLLVDGYNVIHANASLAKVAADSLDAARKKLCDALCEFRALSRYRIIVVFDAHLVAGGIGSVENHRGIKVIFTKEAETADHYIEAATYKLARKKQDKITVATSDTLEQLIILAAGASRISAADLWTEIETTRKTALATHKNSRPIKKNPIESLIDPETAQILENMRYAK
ncbi:MAG: NYN domain-containing protein [Defluviitaleaceae bacterium]|nr:NYN domain-containing protein [Defluviitaleaceae bacterium]